MALAIVLAIGIALGQALDDSSAPSGTETSVRTLEPGTQSVHDRDRDDGSVVWEWAREEKVDLAKIPRYG